MNKKLITLGITFSTLFIVSSVFAQTGNERIDWCHCEPNGNCQTLSLPLQALEQAGHSDANGNPLHAGDHPGACVYITPTSAPTDTPIPTLEPTTTPTPTNSPTAVPTQELSTTPTGQPTIQPTSIPTPTACEIPLPTPTVKPPTPTPPISCQLPRGYQTSKYGVSSGTNISVSNYNLLCASQTATNVNISGGNRLVNNIGGSSIQTGRATSVTNQSIAGNSNNTIVNFMGSRVLNTVNIFNTGSGLHVNATASN